jgi:hypothetical protein
MFYIVHYDWNGTKKRLEEYTQIHYEMANMIEDAKFLGRYVPWNKKYHWTHVWEIKNLAILHELVQIDEELVDAEDWTEFGHGEVELYSGPIQ